MLDVNIEKILPVTEVRDSLNKIIDDVESTDELYVITKNGKPAAIVVGVHHLEKLTGISHQELMPDENPSSQPAASSATAADDSAQQASTPPPTNTTDDNVPAATPSVFPAASTEPVQPLETPAMPPAAPASGFSTAQPAETPAPNSINMASTTAPAPADDIFGTSDSNAFPEDDLFKPADTSQPVAPTTPPVTPGFSQPVQTPPAQSTPAQTPPPANPMQQ